MHSIAWAKEFVQKRADSGAAYDDGDADLIQQPKKRKRGMTMTDAWADWLLKHSSDERYQNLIKLLRMMMVFSSNSACCERSGSAMSLVKTNRRNRLLDSTLMYLQVLYTYRLRPEQLDWDRVVSRFMKNQTNLYFEYFYQK